MRFRKKPVIIEAYPLPEEGELAEPFMEWAREVDFQNFHSDADEGIIIQTLEGDMRADPGDYVIKGVKGEFYACKPDIFRLTYEAVE